MALTRAAHVRIIIHIMCIYRRRCMCRTRVCARREDGHARGGVVGIVHARACSFPDVSYDAVIFVRYACLSRRIDDSSDDAPRARANLFSRDHGRRLWRTDRADLSLYLYEKVSQLFE